MKIKPLNIFFLYVLAMFCSCGESGGGKQNAAFMEDSVRLSEYDLAEIEASGEIIAVTVYGRETYYTYHERSMGLAYELLCNYAANNGLRVRMEIVKDTTSMINALMSGEADVIVCEIATETISRYGMTACGAYSDSVNSMAGDTTRFCWAVRKNQQDLAHALDNWYQPALKTGLRSNERKRTGSAAVRRRIKAPYLSRSKGIISQYDALFVRGSRVMGWDWRLIAAQCYQESGFDPQAVSWAGAKGLMQIMPSTAKSLGLSDTFDPSENIGAGCRYIRSLQNKFADVRNRRDRICFTLAAYNGGYHHIRDAMNLAVKNGKDAKKWNDVKYYILNLSNPLFYNDPVVKNGYMIGSETYNYVESIMQRWEKYRNGKPIAFETGDAIVKPVPSKRKNRFTKQQNIVSLKDSI